MENSPRFPTASRAASATKRAAACATGSGSPVIRGILEYEDLWGDQRLAERDFKQAAKLAIRLLQTAGQFDSATGQARPEDKVYPIIASITDQGYQFMPEEELAVLFQESTKRK